MDQTEKESVDLYSIAEEKPTSSQSAVFRVRITVKRNDILSMQGIDTYDQSYLDAMRKHFDISLATNGYMTLYDAASRLLLPVKAPWVFFGWNYEKHDHIHMTWSFKGKEVTIFFTAYEIWKGDFDK